MEQLNIVGKRSGEGFVAHKVTLVDALSRAVADRVSVIDMELGRKGFLNYLKALAGSNVVKIVPAAVDAGESQVNGHKGLRVVCGANTSYLEGGEWITDRTPHSLCQLRVSPSATVNPNIGALELSEALSRVLPFTAKDKSRPVLACIHFTAKEGKLTMTGADGFRLAVLTVDCEGEGQALIDRDDIGVIIAALRRAKRARIGFTNGREGSANDITVDTELVSYRWLSVDGSYPDYEKLIPHDFTVKAHFDTQAALKAVNSLKALASEKAYAVDLTIGGGKLVLASTDGNGQAEMPIEAEGEGRIRVNGDYLVDALKASGGMVELNVVNAHSPMLFKADGYQLVVMPMFAGQTEKPKEAETPETSKPATAVEQAEAIAKAKAKAEPKAKAKAEPKAKGEKADSRKREPVAV